MSESTSPIPNRLIFIWFGKHFPLGNLLSMQSARKQCRPEEILLIADQPEAIVAQLGAAATWPELRIEKAGVHWFDGLSDGERMVRGQALARELYESCRQPAAKANLLRLAALYRLGGIYLDCDTLTIADLAPLRALRGFCGSEPVVFPSEFHGRRNPLKWLGAGFRLALRDLLARLPHGWRSFRALEGLYDQAANNAIIGAEAGHPLLEACFAALESIPSADRLRRFRLGTHLLQSVTGNRSHSGFQMFPAAYFYPLGPEISNHWFRPGTARHIEAMLTSDCLVVHWYNSVEARYLKEELSEAWLRRNSDTAMAELVRRYA